VAPALPRVRDGLEASLSGLSSWGADDWARIDSDWSGTEDLFVSAVAVVPPTPPSRRRAAPRAIRRASVACIPSIVYIRMMRSASA